MLKDNRLAYSFPAPQSLGVADDIEARRVLAFIDECIAGFPVFYRDVKDSEKENRISDFLIYYLEWHKDQKNSFIPFRFEKNPTQADSGRETDIGVYSRKQRLEKPVTIIEFEAKRFSVSSNGKEYVCGERGGLERFKRGLHASHRNICGMFGYVQTSTSQAWIGKINQWIGELALTNMDDSIDWKDDEEKLKNIDFKSDYVSKCSSTHNRKGYNIIY